MVIQEPKITYTLQVTGSYYDGFSGKIISRKKISGNNIVRDTKTLKNPLFVRNDLVKVTIEFVNTIGIDKINDNEIIFYVVVFNIATNGFYTKSHKGNESRFKPIHFFESRGMITSPLLKHNEFEPGDYVKITLRRI